MVYVPKAELRQDPITREWVIIAAERANRPNDFSSSEKEHRKDRLEKQKPDCPFCEGNEDRTPPEICAYRSAESEPNAPGWWIRTVPNRFPALGIEGRSERRRVEDFYRMMDGIGAHEVIIETPEHSATIGTMSDEQAGEVVLMYLDRFLDLKKDERFEVITCFRNRGERAGASLLHPHSQLIATPMVPGQLRQRLEMAFRYYDDHGECVFCEMMKKEMQDGARVVLENEEFVVFEPFAARVPFETWVVPREHRSDFEGISADDAKALGSTLNAILGLIYEKLDDPDYNFIVRTEPLREDHGGYFHWFVQILPRLTTAAGFEMGSGIYINPLAPERAAEFLRGE